MGIFGIANTTDARCEHAARWLAVHGKSVGRWIHTFSWCPVSVAVGVLAAVKLR